jgi:hypothetical protein
MLGKNNKNLDLATIFQIWEHVPTFVHFVFFAEVAIQGMS